MNKFIRNLLVSVFFLGYFPIASGTLTSAITAVCYYFFLPEFTITENILFLFIIVVISIIFVPIIKSAEKDMGKDSHKIVIDEVIGYCVAILFLPHSLMIAIYAFVLFRVFDVAKPPPIYQIQSLPHGWGVIADDIVAGIYTNIVLQIFVILFPRFFDISHNIM
ncbi:MAG: phosphatidylglycerophosphatase A [Candidatus Cloacimonetes bacterium]|nr:phosphatidylglycerophosphatase A [Candidatus Cloacimonadota bacterium]MBL7086165.1 phosphatidylglycerophosphatase A [Candidatus Cloacimonadota bacterium]